MGSQVVEVDESFYRADGCLDLKDFSRGTCERFHCILGFCKSIHRSYTQVYYLDEECTSIYPYAIKAFCLSS
jgi:hypothetical protein